MFGNNNAFKLDKLKEGYTFDLNMKAWQIIGLAEYDWKADGNSVEYTLKSKNDTAFLEVEYYKGNYELCFSKAIHLENEVLEIALEDKALVYNGRSYALEETYEGAYKNHTKGGSWEDLTAYVFYNKKTMITIEDWGAKSYEVFFGEALKTKALKHIKAGKL